jgi:hypothetical protein
MAAVIAVTDATAQANCRTHLHTRAEAWKSWVKSPVKAECLAAVKTAQERRRAEARRLAI